MDPEATTRLRRRLRAERLGGADPAREPGAGPRAGFRRLTETLSTNGTSFACSYCAGILAVGENPREGCRVLISEVGKASPWVALRWAGRSPNFELREYVCPHCGLLLDVHLRRRGEDGTWNDSQLAACGQGGAP